MKKSVKFYTLGCKTNQYETQAIREGILSSGLFKEVGPMDRAQLYIINTCTVTGKADKDCRWLIRRSLHENPKAEIVVTGCLTEFDENMIKEIPGVSLIVRNNDKHKIKDLLKTKSSTESNKYGPKDYIPLKISDFHDRTRAFIKIQDGCDNFCSYCKVPLVRGRSRSRELEDILNETDRLLNKGFKEIVFTGICLGDWGKSLKKELKLSYLLKEIDKIKGDFRIRLSSIEPNMVDKELIKTIAESHNICRHFHVPLQSGSNRILGLMNRPYKARDFMRLTRMIRRSMPEASITTDVMIGFPGETWHDFKRTARVIRNIMPLRLHIFTYSKRPGTQAFLYKEQIKPAEAKKRKMILEKISIITSLKYRKRLLKKQVRGLVEDKRDPLTGLLTGHTDTYVKFLLNGPDSLMGRLIPLSLLKLDEKSTFFKYLSP